MKLSHKRKIAHKKGTYCLRRPAAYLWRRPLTRRECWEVPFLAKYRSDPAAQVCVTPLKKFAAAVQAMGETLRQALATRFRVSLGVTRHTHAEGEA